MDGVHITCPFMPASPPARSTYRHGDLRRALVEAGVLLAREGGPGAIALREATRRAGVAPNAAYRHFASHSELLEAVRAEALVAAARSMEKEFAAIQMPEGRQTKARLAERARARLRAVGAGYVHFALAEPGLFRTAFTRPQAPPKTSTVPQAYTSAPSGANPFRLLGAALDGVVSSGVLAPQRREHAEFVAWSAVHGLAMLVLDGPLHQVPRRNVEGLIDQVLDMVDRGL
jgi:AcrR family transcriptional regulator